MSVALELLSVDFADMKVRRLAVQRLDILSNDEVLEYLLQLVQTLKVEPYHDSCLARFLLKRALRSKRIGHYFFWYLRSEVAGCPFFPPAYGVKYLLGCGEAMLTEFQRQVQVVNCLHEVALTVKALYQTEWIFHQQLLRSCRSYWRSAIYPLTSRCLLIPLSEQEVSYTFKPWRSL